MSGSFDYRDRYLHTESHHHPPQKSSVVNFLIHRALFISNAENIDLRSCRLKVITTSPIHVVQFTQVTLVVLIKLEYLNTNVLLFLLVVSNICHRILFDNKKILAKITLCYSRKIREALEIHKHANNISRGTGLHLSSIWKSVVPTSLAHTLPPPPSLYK